MTFWKKGIMAFMIAGVMVLGFPQDAEACTMTKDCTECRITAVCGVKLLSSVVPHTAVGANGYQESCLVYTISSEHDMNCRGCGALLYKQTRACEESHLSELCQDKHNMCQIYY